MKVVDDRVEVTNISYITKDELALQIELHDGRIVRNQTELEEKKALMEQL